MPIAIRGYGQNQKIPSWGYGGIAIFGTGDGLFPVPKEIFKEFMIRIIADVSKELDHDIKIVSSIGKDNQDDLIIKADIEKNFIMGVTIGSQILNEAEFSFEIESELDYENLIDIVEKI